MNTDYAHAEGFATFTGDVKRAFEISKWCKDRKLVHEVDYKYHCQRRDDSSTIIFQFKDPKQATIARLVWI
jgi:hypothetical protein